MKKELTAKQRDIYEFIQSRLQAGGNSPTVREIGKKFKISSTNGVRTHLNALIRKGYLRKQDHVSRGLTLARPLTEGIGRLPIVGAVPAGQPIDAIENIEGEIAVDISFVPKGESFSLRVTGDSMKNAGIFDGDVVIVKKQPDANRGDIVVAVVNGEATVKRYVPGERLITLQPENEDFEPITVNPAEQEFRLAGKVVGLVRRIG